MSNLLFTSTHISFVLLFLGTGSAEADVKWGGTFSRHLMATYVRNICTKNY